MERIMYRKTLDLHKNGIQFMLQGFETADNMSRVIEISLMASGDAIDFPMEKVEALMYVTTPSASEPSINKCTIKDNKVVYEVLPIVEEGITNMQLKIIETSTDGATGILASPKFAVEVTKSDADDGNAEQTTTFTALEDAMAKAKAVYDERFLRMELSSDCVFRAYYADGTIYETDVLQKLFLNGNVLLSESFAHGGTGIRAGEDTDNSKYYSNVSKSEALKAKSIMENSEEILEEVKLHGVYTIFKVDFETGEVEYVSPSHKFKTNLETGHLDAIGQANTYTEEIVRVVTEWFSSNRVKLDDLQDNAKQISELNDLTETHTGKIETLEKRVTPISSGGTGADNKADALKNLGFKVTAEQISEVVENSQWETISSLVINSNAPAVGTSDVTTKTFTMPCEETIINDYSQFRYVIKKGATFTMVGTITSAITSAIGDFVLYCKHNGVSYPFVDFYIKNSGENLDYTHIFNEDKAFLCPNISDSYFKYDVYGATDIVTNRGFENLIQIFADHYAYAGGGGYTQCSLTIELQGRRL